MQRAPRSGCTGRTHLGRTARAILHRRPHTGPVPELPEVESARAAIERAALRRRIADVDDTDTYECRPHRPGEIASALRGRELSGAHRRGKTMWCTTSGVGGDDAPGAEAPGPELGLHLGMSGRLVITGAGGEPVEGGDRLGGRYASAAQMADEHPGWVRFAITFADGGSLRLVDPRRLGRARLDPDVDALGPDAAEVGREEFRTRVGGGRTAVKARLLDQSVVAGVGNLLADQTLWEARIDPRRRVDTLDEADLDHLRVVLRRATRAAISRGGVHTGEIIAHRADGEHCPRCGAPMRRGTVGGRTTWWCSREQR